MLRDSMPASTKIMQKKSWSFAIRPLDAPVAVTGWGHYGMPVVLFASAGGDTLEPERLQLIAALAPLLEGGRIKLYAVDGAAMRVLLAGTATAPQRLQAQQVFDEWIATGLGAHIRQDCQSDALELLACGCALGAASAVKALLRSPQLFRGAIGLSGTYDLRPWIAPLAAPADYSPLQWPAQLPEGAQLARLRQRSVTLACTAGTMRIPLQRRRSRPGCAERGIEARVAVWGAQFRFGFCSWREMLPRMIGELAGAGAL